MLKKMLKYIYITCRLAQFTLLVVMNLDKGTIHIMKTIICTIHAAGCYEIDR